MFVLDFEGDHLKTQLTEVFFGDLRIDSSFIPPLSVVYSLQQEQDDARVEIINCSPLPGALK